MNKTAKFGTAAVAGALVLATAAHAGWQINKTPTAVFADGSRDCVFFMLDGVAEADPVRPGAPWFALQRSHPHFSELFALLLTARANRVPLNVETNGTTVSSCSSLAAVHAIGLP